MTASTSHKLRAKIFVNIVFVVILTISILSTILYVNFEKISLSLIHSYVSDSLYQISNSANYIVGSAKTLALQIYSDVDISKLYRNNPPDVDELNKAINRLASYRAATPFISSIYIYNGVTETFYTDYNAIIMQNKTNFFDVPLVKILDNDTLDIRMKPIVRKIVTPANTDKLSSISFNVYSYIFTEHPNTRSKLNYAVILNVSLESIRSAISTFSENSNADTFIIDENGIVVSSGNSQLILKDIHSESYVQKTLNNQTSSGYFIDKINGTKSLVTFASNDESHWKFIRITPYTQIVSKINAMKQVTIIICMAILGIGILLTLFISRSLYQPIGGMIAKVLSLESEKRNSLYTLKQEFLQNILRGEATYPIKELSRKFEELKINLQVEGNCLLLFIEIDQFVAFCNEFNVSDRNLMKFSILNIACELLSVQFRNDGTSTDENGVVMILNPINKNEEILSKTFEDSLHKIQESLLKYLNLSVSITVSAIGKMSTDLSELYIKTMDASKSKVFSGNQSIIYSHQLITLDYKQYIYPIQKEKQLLDSLMLDRTAEVKSFYHEIINGTKGYSHTILFSTVLSLAANINTAIHTFAMNSNFMISYHFNTFINDLSKMETLEDINNHFYTLFNSISAKIRENKDKKYDELIDHILTIIKNNYMDPNLSLSSIAESCNISADYLGRLFKKQTLKSVADYINLFRIEKAKELMLTTNHPINDILVNIGITNNSYFYTMFKKVHGITPNEFRQKATNDK